MNPNKFKTLLLNRKKELDDQLKSLGTSAKPVDLNDPIGRLSRMDAIQQQQMALNAKRQTENSIQQVEAALARIDDGTYGVCLKCEEEISEKRLLAKPEAPFCTDCQS